MFNIDLFLANAVKSGASDVHLTIGERPVVRRDGKIFRIDMKSLSDEDMDNILSSVVPNFVKGKVEISTDMDFAYEVKNVSRFRVNLNRQLGKYGLVFRTIPYDIKTFEMLCLPPTIKQFAKCNNGLVVVTGPTGSGKSTTLASFIDYININSQKHIITIEDPVEFIFTNKQSIVTQRQIGVDTPNYTTGIKYALRQDPDVILIGEIRDKDTIESALKAAETGHLVFATLHTNDAIQTINRIINMFDPKDREQVKNQLAQSLRGTISQRLIKKAGSDGRYPACEVLVVTSTVKDFIKKDKIEDIYEIVRNGSFNDMITLNDSLFELSEAGIITKEDAIANSNDVVELQQMMRGVYRGTKGGIFNE